MPNPSPEFFDERPKVFVELDDVVSLAFTDYAEGGALPYHLRCQPSRTKSEGTVSVVFLNWEPALKVEIDKVETPCLENEYMREPESPVCASKVKYFLVVTNLSDEPFEVDGLDEEACDADWIAIEVYEDGNVSLYYKSEVGEDGDDITVLELHSTHGADTRNYLHAKITEILDLDDWLEDFRMYREASFRAAFADNTDS